MTWHDGDVTDIPTEQDRIDGPPLAVRPEQIVDDAVRRYFAARRGRVKGFVDRHFSLKGAVALHRHALGRDVLRAPVNVAMMLPTAAALGGAWGLRRLGAERPAEWLSDRNLFLQTDVAREIQWLIHSELLELPYEDGGRRCKEDALAREILADVRVSSRIERLQAELTGHADDPAVRQRLAAALETYSGTRTAAAEITNNLFILGAGALTLKQVTPGVLSLGPALAAAIAHHVAIVSFPLGAGLGSLWYGVFPGAAPSLALVAGTTAGLIAVAAMAASVSGVITDPIQRELGLHERRLLKLLDTLERNFLGWGEARFVPRDHYVARLGDLFDALALATRALR